MKTFLAHTFFWAGCAFSKVADGFFETYQYCMRKSYEFDTDGKVWKDGGYDE